MNIKKLVRQAKERIDSMSVDELRAKFLEHGGGDGDGGKDTQRTALDDLKKMAFMSLVEARVDLSVDEYTPPNLKAFLAAANISPEDRAEYVRKVRGE